MLFVLYLLVCVTGLGVADLSPAFSISSPWGVFNGADVLLIALLVLTIPGYLQQRQKIGGGWFRVVEAAWIVFIALLTVQSYRSQAATLTERLRNVRFVQGYLLFFPSVAVLTTRSRLRALGTIGGLFAVAGVIITILQVRHGLTNLTGSPFYDTGPWPGEKDVVGGITRVQLAISDWIGFCLLCVLGFSLVRFRVWHLLLAGFLCVAILVSFTRLFWLGLAVGLLVEVALLLVTGGTRLQDALKLSLAPLALGLVLLGVTQVPSLGGLSEAVAGRLANGLFNLSNTSGTWEVRLAAQNVALTVWAANPLFGVGTIYRQVVGQYLDLGLPATLVSIGAVGLIIDFLMLLACLLAGIATLKKGNERNSLYLKVIGVALPAQVVVILVYQQWMSTRDFAILAIASALALTGPFVPDEVREAAPRRRRGFVYQIPAAKAAQQSTGPGA